ncbi:MAG: tRNA 2-thiouridine(34) synthase MnmA [Bacteroidales bacterium]
MQKVVVGLSGGVDSSVAAFLLKEQGYDVTGLFMINWHDTTGTLSGDCPWHDDLIFAELVAQKLGIPFHTTDLSGPYRQRVVDYMFSEYEKGRTPNPDVLCNREIKFDMFIEEALKLGADFVATGHYCKKTEQVLDGDKIYSLHAGDDLNKDQSYFLCQLNQHQLSRALFPLGNIQKPEVREIAAQMGLATAEKKDSQGICFVGKVDLPLFLQQKLQTVKGDIIEIPKGFYRHLPVLQEIPDNIEGYENFTLPVAYRPDDGIKIGSHNGAWFYTTGQRKGLNIGGKKEPLFVISTDIEKNLVYVGEGHAHPGLNRRGLFIKKEEVHWIRTDLKMHPGDQEEYMVRIRYRQPLQKAKLFLREKGLYIIFETPQRGIAAGQFAAWYRGSELNGSGVIN